MNLLLNIRAKYCFLRANGIYYNCQQKGVDRMAGNTTNISIRMDADLKAQADALFTELGMNLTTAFNIFVRQSLREGGIPFEVRLEQPNKETVAAMLEAERIAKDPSVKGYNDLDELFADLKDERNQIYRQVHDQFQKRLQTSHQAWLEDRTAGAGRSIAGNGRTAAG